MYGDEKYVWKHINMYGDVLYGDEKGHLYTYLYTYTQVYI